MAEKMKVRELMTVKVATLGRDDTLDIADGVMSMGRIRHLPVLDDGQVVGVVTQRDLFRSALGAALAFGIGRPQALTRSLEIRDVMSQPVVTVAPGCRRPPGPWRRRRSVACPSSRGGNSWASSPRTT
jgi:CBS domain-containing membrane protein